MRLPDGTTLMHAVQEPYDPAKAHAYYLRTRKLKGRKKGTADQFGGKPPAHAHAPARGNQKKALAARISELEGKLKKLEDLIKQKEKASKKPTASDKHKKARESKKFRQKHKQELKTKAKKAAKSSGGGSSKGKKSGGSSVKELKALATKVKGQIAIAKTKLRAL